MIREALHREFVWEHLARVRGDLEKVATTPGDLDRRGDANSERRGLTELPPADPEDYQAAREELSAAQQHSPVAEEDKERSAPPGERRAEQKEPDPPYLERNAAVSLLQTAIEEYVERKRRRALRTQQPSPGGQRDEGPVEIPVTPNFLQGNDPERRILNKFSITDVRWVSSVFAQGIRALRKRHLFVDPPLNPYPIDNHARLILVGDWGTGIPRAIRVAERIREWFQKEGGERRQRHVIHLGDVYYSGWKTEYLRYVLAPERWPVKPGEAKEIGSWSLNGNHDMYSGGHAYYDVLLADPRFKRQAGSSFFALQNDKWHILGLDTAYEDEGLRDPQADWAKARAHDGSMRKIMLLSHHQPISAYEKPCPKVAKKLGATLESGHVHAWFWGHEHRCALYKPSLGVGFPRCVGNGGIPTYMRRGKDDPFKNPADFEYRGLLRGSTRIEPWALFGFAVLDFNDSWIDARYIDENGEEFRRERIE
jgi:hypothetical protein